MLDNQIDLVHEALRTAVIEKDDINEVLLFGGSSRVLSVKSRLQEYFGEYVNIVVPPDSEYAVARGATIMAGHLRRQL